MSSTNQYKLSLEDFKGEVEFYEEYTRRVDRAREMDRWSESLRSQNDINNSDIEE